ncbi:COBW domain-containing protein 1 isoform X1 [Iris pallida]|uniref:COBW domain-containing protein 1 isoform X1 n=1 Tax=Iris pallida TaxID=29817 RepID=A0AAX6GSF0_IRIPA|nr:COBW domain-containing protein 1 isoform X1 [Iris pallida]
MMLKEHRDSASFPEEFLQIAFTDVVILNKVDLIIQEEPGHVHLEELDKEIHNINSLETVIQSVRCQVDLHNILDREAYGATHIDHLEALLQDIKASPVQGRYDYSVRTLCIYEQHPVDLDKVQSWLEDLLWEKKSSMDIYRYKGVLYVHNSDQLHTLQTDDL